MARHKPRIKRVDRAVYWAVMGERAMYGSVAEAREDIAAYSVAHGCKMLRLNAPARIDIARNQITRVFMEKTSNPHDTLVMLDNDHEHKKEVVVRLASHDLGVVGALCFRRGTPYDPMVFLRMEDGELGQPEEWGPNVIVQCAIVGSGAIAIQRWVFEKLEKEGFKYPYWRIKFVDGQDPLIGEDWFFGLSCEKAGIPHHCDMGLESPHCLMSTITSKTFISYRDAQKQIAEAKAAEGTSPAPSRKWFEFGGKA